LNNNNTGLTTKPDTPLTAEFYWGAEQLQVMRGLSLPVWYRPFLQNNNLKDDALNTAYSSETTEINVQSFPSIREHSGALPTSERSGVLNVSVAEYFKSTTDLSAIPHMNIQDLKDSAENCNACSLGQNSLVCRKPWDMTVYIAPSTINNTDDCLNYLLVVDSLKRTDLLNEEELKLVKNIFSYIQKVSHKKIILTVTALLKCTVSSGLNENKSRNDGAINNGCDTNTNTNTNTDGCIDSIDYKINFDHCKSYLKQQISLIKPNKIVALGGFVAQCLLEIDDTVQNLNNNMGNINNDGYEYEGVPLLFMDHPADILNQPALKRSVWQMINHI
jgi:hypothetical protein